MNPAEPLRILVLLEAGSITGTAKAVLEFAREASASVMVTVAIFVREDGPVSNSLTRTLQAKCIPFRFIRETGRFDFAVLNRLRDLVKELDPTILWSNSVKSHFLVYLSGAQSGRKWVAFHHGYTSPDFKMRLYNELDRVSLRHATRVLTVCQPFAAQMLRRGVPADRIRVQHMPIRPFEIDPEKVRELRAQLKIGPGAKVILSVGRLSREKGHINLVRAFSALRARKQLQDLTLVIVGDGPERKKLRQIADDSVIFTGHRDDVNTFYGLADVLVLPSYTEGTPNVILEAMSAGVPVIATNVGGIPELAADRESALLVESGNVSALENAVVELLESSKLQQSVVTSARKVVTDHSPRLYFSRLLSIFEEA